MKKSIIELAKLKKQKNNLHTLREKWGFLNVSIFACSVFMLGIGSVLASVVGVVFSPAFLIAFLSIILPTLGISLINIIFSNKFENLIKRKIAKVNKQMENFKTEEVADVDLHTFDNAFSIKNHLLENGVSDVEITKTKLLDNADYKDSEVVPYLEIKNNTNQQEDTNSL